MLTSLGSRHAISPILSIRGDIRQYEVVSQAVASEGPSSKYISTWYCFQSLRPIGYSDAIKRKTASTGIFSNISHFDSVPREQRDLGGNLI